MVKEKYYWVKNYDTYVPVDELSDLHICNIIMMFGKPRLNSMGYNNIVRRFEELNVKYDFFKSVRVEHEIDENKLYI